MKNVTFSFVFLKSLQGLQFVHASILDLKSRLRAGAMKAKKKKTTSCVFANAFFVTLGEHETKKRGVSH